MSLIFDRFKTRQRALDFKAQVKRSYGLGGQLFSTAQAAQQRDPFPGELVPMIIHIDRCNDLAIEQKIQEMAPRFGGSFVGT